MDEYITPKEAAALLHIDTSTLRRWHRQGRLENVRVIKTQGGQRRWHAEDLKSSALKDASTSSPIEPSPIVVSLLRWGKKVMVMSLLLTIIYIAQKALIGVITVSQAAKGVQPKTEFSGEVASLQLTFALALLSAYIIGLALIGVSQLLWIKERKIQR